MAAIASPFQRGTETSAAGRRDHGPRQGLKNSGREVRTQPDAGQLTQTLGILLQGLEQSAGLWSSVEQTQSQFALTMRKLAVDVGAEQLANLF